MYHLDEGALLPQTRHFCESNICVMQLIPVCIRWRVIFVSAVDSALKDSSGQAVQKLLSM